MVADGRDAGGPLMSVCACGLRRLGCGTSPGRWPRCCGRCMRGQCPDLHRRLWLYALAYTIRQIIFWPPDRAEADDPEVTHPLHTLRRLIDAPLPHLAADLP